VVIIEVAAPMSSVSTAFCTDSMSAGVVMPMPAPTKTMATTATHCDVSGCIRDSTRKDNARTVRPTSGKTL
jgi:hypothetical protein